MRQKRLFNLDDEIGFELSESYIEWLSGVCVDTDDEETHDGLYKYALSSIQIEGWIEAQGYHIVQAGVCILWHTFWSECPV